MDSSEMSKLITFELTEEIRSMSIAKMGLSQRTSSALLKAGVKTLGDLDGYTRKDILHIRNMGSTHLMELEQTVKAEQERASATDEPFIDNDLIPEADDATIEELGLTMETYYVLKAAGISRVMDIVSSSKREVYHMCNRDGLITEEIKESIDIIFGKLDSMESKRKYYFGSFN